MTDRSRANQASRRRGRLLIVVGFLLGAAVLVTGMPVSALFTQHHQLAQAAAQLKAVDDANAALAAQAKTLQNPAGVAALARTEYGMVPTGQKAYVILPPAGSSPSTVAGSGHVPLDGPVVTPGSPASQALLGVGPDGVGVSTSTTVAGARHASSGSTHHGGFWTRVVHALEFWH